MILFSWIALVFIFDVNLTCGKVMDVHCCMSASIVSSSLYILPDDCREAEFVIDTDFKTKCRVCDSNICGPQELVCPVIDCPMDSKIEAECRRTNFIIGTDRIIKCMLCDSSVCGKKKNVCPQITCHDYSTIPKRCRVKRYAIGEESCL